MFRRDVNDWRSCACIQDGFGNVENEIFNGRFGSMVLKVKRRLGQRKTAFVAETCAVVNKVMTVAVIVNEQLVENRIQVR